MTQFNNLSEIDPDVLYSNATITPGAEIAIHVGVTGMGVHVEGGGQLDPDDITGRDAQTLGHNTMVVTCSPSQ